MSSLPELDPIVSRLIKGDVILDVGCGKGKWGYFSRLNNPKAYLVGLDLELENLEFCKRYGLYDDLILARAPELPFRPKSFDCVIAAEVIEHMSKREGYKLLDQVELISRNIVIVTTPAPRAVFTMGKGHISSWDPKELRKRGFKVIGVRAMPLFYVQNKFKRFIVTIMMGMAIYFPGFSTDMVAYKILGRCHRP